MILNFSSLLFASLFTGAAGLSYHEAIDAIKTDLKGYETLGGQGLCDRNDCCTISETNSCSLDAFAKDKSMLVLPGGETRCIFSTSTEFAFQVIPGDTDKLLFYFQGGGACWDKVSTVTVPLCTTDASPSGLNGIFDRSNLDNAYRDYTVVQVLYCSGDIHGNCTHCLIHILLMLLHLYRRQYGTILWRLQWCSCWAEGHRQRTSCPWLGEGTANHWYAGCLSRWPRSYGLLGWINRSAALVESDRVHTEVE